MNVQFCSTINQQALNSQSCQLY
uniref:Uncharacterized protein n=1 Tax=Anguilla anguilla TaxID=7936 RepID=A0A0E9UPP2_ANGAN